MGDILFLAHRVPYPPDRGDKIRSFNILKYLSARKRVHLVSFADDSRDLRRKEALSPDGYAEMLASTTLLNRVGAELGRDPAVHAVTDVTGFGLLGHAWELAERSGVAVTLRAGSLPARHRKRPGGSLLRALRAVLTAQCAA